MKMSYSWRRRKFPAPHRKGLKDLFQKAFEIIYGQDCDGNFNIVFAGSRTVSRINWNYLRHKGKTDVICFVYNAIESSISDDLDIEIFICVDTALEVGKEIPDSSYSRELVLYLVHGLLHGAGKDDINPLARAEMKSLERQIMDKLEKEFNFYDIFSEPIE